MTQTNSQNHDTQTVAVAMSGGVDSSVAAALLLKDGHHVIGVTLKLHPDNPDSELPEHFRRSGCSSESIYRAHTVADQLRIPHHVVDCSHEFESLVLRPAWDEYARGRTPSPCLVCNERVKFGALLSWAKQMGAEYLATGHYARIETVPGRNPILKRGLDTNKDQTYFLAGLSPKQLKSILFPLGHYTKPGVRKLAASMGLSSAKTQDSQDACFSIPGHSFPESLRKRFEAENTPGPVLDESGCQLGTHDGIHNFTVGQRRGFGIASKTPMWVKHIDPENAEIILTSDKQAMLENHLVADNVNWLDDEKPLSPRECHAQVRYRHTAQPAMLQFISDRRVDIRFSKPVRAITPGQAAVFYDGDRVLGRGWIL